MALAAAVVVGVLGGAAVSGLDSVVAPVAGGSIGLAAGVVCLALAGIGWSVVAAGLAAAATAGLVGAGLAWAATRDDGEHLLSVIGTGIMAAVLGGVAVLVVQLLVADRD